MDTELARTFLAVVAAGSFVEAAQRLCVTQSTVSSRIQRLEEQLGAELFARQKAGAILTPAGKAFQRHAAILTSTVERARHDIGIVGGFRATLTIGGRVGLWEDLLLHWLPEFARIAPDIAVRALTGFEEELMAALIEGRADIGVMYSPQARPGLTVERLFEERLVMVSTRPSPPMALDHDYIYVEWGPEFFARHSLAFPDFAGAGVTVNIGWLGLQKILAYGGSGYFPIRMVSKYEREGVLHRVQKAPEFALPAYVCYSSGSRSDAIEIALGAIRTIAARVEGNLPD